MSDIKGVHEVKMQIFSCLILQDSKNCITSIVARPQHQIEILINTLDLDGNAVLDKDGNPEKCFDFVKLFNGMYMY